MKITFPGFDFKFNVSKVAITICEFEIHWYAIIISVAIFISLILLRLKLRKKEKNIINFNDIIELLIRVLPIGIISARLYYIVFNLEYYLRYPYRIFNIRSGGLAIYGGLIGAIIVICFFCKKRKINILDVTDLLAPYFSLSQAIGRWGNFVNIEAYGYETKLPWRMGIIEWGVYKEVHPTFLYESICTSIIFIILLKVDKTKEFKGETTYIYIILYSFSRMLIESIRKDSLMLYNLKISRVLSAFLFVIFSIILIYKIANQRKTNKLSIKQNKMTYKKSENA